MTRRSSGWSRGKSPAVGLLSAIGFRPSPLLDLRGHAVACPVRFALGRMAIVHSVAPCGYREDVFYRPCDFATFRWSLPHVVAFRAQAMPLRERDIGDDCVERTTAWALGTLQSSTHAPVQPSLDVFA